MTKSEQLDRLEQRIEELEKQIDRHYSSHNDGSLDWVDTGRALMMNLGELEQQALNLRIELEESLIC